MKSFVLIFVATIICGSSSKDTGPLPEAFEYLTEAIKSVSESKSYGKYINKIDFDCAKEMLNLTQNGHKMVNEVQGIITAVASYVKCLKTNDEETVDFATKLVTEEYRLKDGEPSEFDIQFNICYKLKLQELEPTSKLLDNFDGNTIPSDVTELCGIISIDELADHTIKPIEDQIGPLETGTCGSVDQNLVANFLIKFNLIHAEKRTDVKKEETQKMVDLFRSKIIATSDCVLRNV
jgi:hypothetical protein